MFQINTWSEMIKAHRLSVCLKEFGNESQEDGGRQNSDGCCNVLLGTGASVAFSWKWFG